MNKVKVLLIYPDADHPYAGGISRWMRTVLDYYSEIQYNNDNYIELVHCKNVKHIGNIGKGICRRLIVGIVNCVRFYKILKRTIYEEKYDVAHICTSASFGLIRDLFFLFLLKKNAIKVVIHFHCGRIPEIVKNSSWEYFLLQKVIFNVDHVIVIDMASYNILKGHGYNNITYLPNMLAPFIRRIIEQNNNIQRDERLILFVGHVVPKKGIYELINACKQLSNVKLLILGPISDEMKQKLFSMVKCCKNEDWLDIMGMQDNFVVIENMLRCGVFVLPTYTEGFPNVIIESMACACSIVTTPVGAIPEMLDIRNKGNECGICVAPKNVEQLRVAIKTMLDNREFAKNCANRARQRVNDLYSIESIWQTMITIWNDIAYKNNK